MAVYAAWMEWSGYWKVGYAADVAKRGAA